MALFPSATKVWHSSPYPSIFPTRSELSMTGKTVVITGGGSGIGLSISQSFALAGSSKIAIIGRRSDVLCKAATSIRDLVGDKVQFLTISADVSNKKQIDSAFSEIRAAFGGKPLDILVNNAGYYSGVRPYGSETIEEWQTAFDVNIKGVYNITTAFIANATPDATLINISSAVAHIEPFHGFSAYATTKMAGARLMECIQTEKPSLHIINLHPGQVVETEMAGKLAANMKHIDDAELAGNFAVWVASPEAKFLKGKFVWVNWDVDELKEAQEKFKSKPYSLTLGLDGYSSFVKYENQPSNKAARLTTA